MNKKKTRTPKTPTMARLVLADNVKALMAFHFHDKENQPQALADAAKTSLSTIQRVLGATTGASVDTMFRLTKAFDLSGTYQLLLPNLNPRNPQIVKGLLPNEARYYDDLMAAYLADQSK